MSRLEKAIAAAREALEFEAPPQFNTHALLRSYRDTLRDLIAALDAARYAAPAAAERDESLIDIGGECVPRWIVEYANALTTYFAERGGRSWAIGGVQSREQAPPAAVAVPADNVTPMRQPRADLARLVESINAAVYANGDGLSVTEAIGALELAKLELLKEQEQ